MKLIGFLFLLSGSAIVMVAVALLRGASAAAFVLAGLGVEMFGLVLVARAHRVLRGEQG